MYIRQLSIFLNNRPGELAKLTELFNKSDIDIRTLVCFDTSDFGIIRAVTTDPERALQVLTDEGYIAKLNNVVVIEPEDKTGSLSEIASLISEKGMNIDYLYPLVYKKGEMPYYVIKTEDIDKTAEVLEKAGIKVIDF